MAQVFLSWSGRRSKAVAEGLADWLPNVFQGLKVWMSDKDIGAGERWSLELTKALESSNFGIVCLTPENLKSEWLLFEAGALSKAIDAARVVPYMFDLKTTDVAPPLSQFKAVDATKPGTLFLTRGLRDAIGSPIDVHQIANVFEKWWPDLKSALDGIPRDSQKAQRTEREMLEELLELVRLTGSRELQEILNRILSMPNVHSMKLAQKFRAGKSTGTVTFVIRVHDKGSNAELPEDQRIPEQIYGIPTLVHEQKD